MRHLTLPDVLIAAALCIAMVLFIAGVWHLADAPGDHHRKNLAPGPPSTRVPAGEGRPLHPGPGTPEWRKAPYPPLRPFPGEGPLAGITKIAGHGGSPDQAAYSTGGLRPFAGEAHEAAVTGALPALPPDEDDPGPLYDPAVWAAYVSGGA